jgi:hypothetical protein
MNESFDVSRFATLRDETGSGLLIPGDAPRQKVDPGSILANE